MNYYITNDQNTYQDINIYYVYSDRFVMQPGEVEYIDDVGGGNGTGGGDSGDDNNNSMTRCLEKRSYEECEKFCKKNGYHSALCR